MSQVDGILERQELIARLAALEASFKSLCEQVCRMMDQGFSDVTLSRLLETMERGGFDIEAYAALAPAPAPGDEPPCPVCGCEVRGQGGYLQCECPVPAPAPEEK